MLRDVVLSAAKNLYDYLRDPSLTLRATQQKRVRRVHKTNIQLTTLHFKGSSSHPNHFAGGVAQSVFEEIAIHRLDRKTGAI